MTIVISNAPVKTKAFDLEECMSRHNGQCITAEGKSARVVYEGAQRKDGYDLVVLVTEEVGECASLHNKRGECVDNSPARQLYLTVTNHRISDGWRNIYRRDDGSIFAGPPHRSEDAATAAAATATNYLKTIENFIEVEV